MRRILLPTDFSKNAYNAITHALKLYKNIECKFYVLNTLYNSNYILYSSLSEVYQHNSEKGLNKLVQRIKEEFPNEKHSFETISSFNTLYNEITQLVDNEKIDLIVMGTNGAAGGEELLFGTHTVHAIKIAKCPLLAIPSERAYQSPDNILFATKFEIDFNEYQMDLLKRICHRHDSKLHIIHANFGNKLNDKQQKAKQALEEFLSDIPHEFYDIPEKSVAEAIETFQEKQSVDLLVMIKHRHTFMERLLFSSVVHEIGFHTKFPFLVLPSEKYVAVDEKDEQPVA